MKFLVSKFLLLSVVFIQLESSCLAELGRMSGRRNLGNGDGLYGVRQGQIQRDEIYSLRDFRLRNDIFGNSEKQNSPRKKKQPPPSNEPKSWSQVYSKPHEASKPLNTEPLFDSEESLLEQGWDSF